MELSRLYDFHPVRSSVGSFNVMGYRPLAKPIADIPFLVRYRASTPLIVTTLTKAGTCRPTKSSETWFVTIVIGHHGNQLLLKLRKARLKPDLEDSLFRR